MDSLELWRNFICGNETGSPGRAVSLHLARSGSQSEHRIRRILPARGACHIIIKFIVMFLDNVFTACSLLHPTLLSLERLYATLFPIRHCLMLNGFTSRPLSVFGS